MKTVETIEDLIVELGGLTRVAEEFGYEGPSAVGNWRARGMSRGLRLEVFARLKARGLMASQQLLDVSDEDYAALYDLAKPQDSAAQRR